MPEGLQIDAVSEDATNTPLDLVDGTNTFLLEAAYPAPERDSMWASSADTEGEALVQHRFRNRVITVRIRVVGSTAANLQTQLKYCQQKAAKLSREGGTLKRTAPSSSTIVFDVVGATLDVPIDRRHLNINRAEVVFTFECKPFGRGTPVTGSAHSESTLPVLVFTETGVGGDVPALGRLVVTEAQGADQWWLAWGVQSRYYDSATTAKLFYEAEDLTPLGTAALNAGPSGASGSGGSKVIRSGALTPAYQGVVSTQASGGGAHLTHTGTFRVFTRVQTASGNGGTVTVALEWGVGDFLRYTRNAPATLPVDLWDATWRLLDLGQVTIPKATIGSQRWEGRIVAASTIAVDTIDIDHLFLVPVDEGSGFASGVQTTATITSFSARDEFDQAAGNLNGKTLPVGGTWATSGDATDLAVDASHYVTRSAGIDAGAGRFAIAGSSTYATIAGQVDVKWSQLSAGTQSSVVLRYVDASNYLIASRWGDNGLRVYKVVAGVSTLIATTTVSLAANQYYSLRFVATATGTFSFWVFATGTDPGVASLEGQDAALATGGTLASGKVGFLDFSIDGANTRTYDNFVAWVPVTDAAVYASQSVEIRYDGVTREDSAGNVWRGVSNYEGDYLLVPPAGREARTARFIVKATRNDPENSADGNIDDISATLTVVPRFLVVPE